MKVERIQKIRNHQIFKNFTWPGSGLDNFSRFNLIFGWNGSGKTTLSNFFRSIEQKKSILEGEIDFVIDGKAIKGTALSTETTLPDIRVFNRDFIEDNVLSSKLELVSPIFFLGQDNIKKQKDLELLENQLDELKFNYNNAKKQLQSADNDLDKFTTQQAGMIKEFLISNVTRSYNNYDKRSFKSKVCQTTDKSKILSEEQKLVLKKKIAGNSKALITQVDFKFPDLTVVLDEILIICESTVLSQVIETLKKDPALAEWVKNGLDLHFNKNSTDTCQFCNQKIPEDRLSDLHNHFNDQYNFFINKAQVKIQQLISINSNLAISFPDKDKFYEHFLTEYEEKIVVATGIIKKYFDFISSLIKALEEKKLKPFESTSFSVHAQLTALPSRDIFDKKISEINLLIDNHNLETCNFENEIAKTAASLEDHFIASALDEYKSKVEYINQAKADEVHIKTEIEQLNISIKEIKKEISEHLIPAEQLNKELTSYLGHSELVFEVKNNSYVISRNGYLAKNLSEGEKTAIAFLYFLKSLQDKSFDIEKSIVVIDDPISSLDTNAIYCAFCFMKERTKNAGQLFILTHNASFFRQTKNWFQHERAKKKSNPTQRPAHFFMLISHIELDGKRAAEITTLDDLLYKYESDYHYMFKLIYEAAKCSQRNIPLESYYGLPNVARRLIESFLAFRYPANIWGLEKKIEIVDFDRPKKLRILRFLHTFSHNDRIHDGEHDLSILRETPDVLKDMLELIRCEDEHHFKEMEIAIASQIGVI